MVLEKGSPATSEGREDREMRTYALLDSLGIEYARVDHAAAQTMEICRSIDETLGAPICKNLFLCNRQGTVFYLLMMPGDKVFKTKELSAQIGSARLSFASGEEMERLLGTTPGSASILGLMNDRDREVTLLIDADILASESIGAHPLVNTASLGLSVAELLTVFLPAVGHTYQKVTL